MQVVAPNLNEPSDVALDIYRKMIDEMGDQGVIECYGCLSITHYAMKKAGNLAKANQLIGELIDASLVLPDPDNGEWRVRLPIRL